MLAPMRHSIALLCLCPLAEPKTVTISNIVERRDVCVVFTSSMHRPTACPLTDGLVRRVGTARRWTRTTAR
jgi:hypothetical protein